MSFIGKTYSLAANGKEVSFRVFAIADGTLYTRNLLSGNLCEFSEWQIERAIELGIITECA
jgi:hypothetical protein